MPPSLHYLPTLRHLMPHGSFCPWSRFFCPRSYMHAKDSRLSLARRAVHKQPGIYLHNTNDFVSPKSFAYNCSAVLAVRDTNLRLCCRQVLLFPLSIFLFSFHLTPSTNPTWSTASSTPSTHNLLAVMNRLSIFVLVLAGASASFLNKRNNFNDHLEDICYASHDNQRDMTMPCNQIMVIQAGCMYGAEKGKSYSKEWQYVSSTEGHDAVEE